MTLTQKLIQFASNHWELVGGFLLLLIILIYEEVRSKGVISGISVHEAVNLINREGALVIDIRDSAAYSNGHITKARHIPSDQIEQNLNKLKAFKEKPVIVVCARGQLSMGVTTKLRKAGFKKVQALKGGMQAWMSASMPTKKGK